MSNERRTNGDQIATQHDLPGLPPQGWGVGDTPLPSPPVGGGYLSICMPYEFSAPPVSRRKFSDPRIAQLEAMGLQRVLIDVAEAIGFEAFMTAWKIFDAAPELRDQGPSHLRLTMRPIGSWRRYLRNCYIEQLFAAGLTNDEVLQRLTQNWKLTLDESRVRQLRGNYLGRTGKTAKKTRRHRHQK